MDKTEQRPQESSSTTRLPDTNHGNSRGTGPRSPGYKGK